MEKFYLEMNYDMKYREHPIVIYHGYYQRRVGCFASGNRSLYVDTDGDIHACPFCQAKTGNVLTGDLDDSIAKLRNTGCHKFDSAPI